MFLTSSDRPIDPELKNIVEEIEQKSPSLSVLAARQLRYCLSQTTMTIEIAKSRQLNILEDFIFRAGVEFNPPATEDELATVLGLDPIFIKNTTATLRNLNTLEKETVIKLTPIGHEFYRDRSVPEAPETQTVYAIAQPFGKIIKSSPVQNEEIDHLPDLEDYIAIENKSESFANLSLLELRELIQNSDLEFHCPENGKFVTSFKVEDNNVEAICQTLSIIVIFDVLENNFRIQAREGTKVLEDASAWLNNLLAEERVALNSLCQLTDEEIDEQCREVANHKNAEVEKRVEIIRQKALDNIRDREQESTSETTTIEAGTAVQLRGAKISQELASILDSAKHQVLIYSPWISRKVVNDRFVKRLQKLANKGVWILIGYGIAKSEEAEDRKVPKEVKEKLEAVLTPEGIPAVQFFWLGGSHAKELIVDRQTHLLGSNNLLSFQASSGLWDESVYKVTIPEQVQQAYEFYALRFENKAHQLWNNSLENKNIELATQALCLWGALEMEEIALERVQVRDWKELYPIWISLVKQGIKARRISPSSACYKQLEELEQFNNQCFTEDFKEADNIYEKKKNDNLVTEIDEIGDRKNEDDKANLEFQQMSQSDRVAQIDNADEYVIEYEQHIVSNTEDRADEQITKKAIQISNETDVNFQLATEELEPPINFDAEWPQLKEELRRWQEEVEREKEESLRRLEEMHKEQEEWQREQEEWQMEYEDYEDQEKWDRLQEEEFRIWEEEEKIEYEEWQMKYEVWQMEYEEWREQEENQCQKVAEQWQREAEQWRKQEKQWSEPEEYWERQLHESRIEEQEYWE